jgi:signal transduction histidine kinase
MAGSQFSASHANNNLRTVVEAHAAQDAERVRRIRELIDTNTQLTVRLGDKVEVAAERATEAVTKATEAAESIKKSQQ